ncbi:DUF1934 family protein [Psychrilyobacter atlanticus]|uniref:DUF1934 family protein n=1 Tax=Psychrilyobacter atlanticus TaxID=271091 RepID=UPI0003F94659|nr:DUF1934 family protein [Psychrilyobacter atlanticus]
MKLRIRTTDSFGEKYDATFDATREENEKGVKYTYADEYAKVRIFILKDKMQIVRDGDIKSNKLLKENQKTSFSYRASYMNRNFEIFTKSLIIEEKKISAEYSIIEENAVVNELTLKIDEL